MSKDVLYFNQMLSVECDWMNVSFDEWQGQELELEDARCIQNGSLLNPAKFTATEQSECMLLC